MQLIFETDNILFTKVSIKLLDEYLELVNDKTIQRSTLTKEKSIAKEKPSSLEDEIIKKSTFDELKKAIELLPEVQKRRIKKYYFEDKTEQQIAEEENATQQSVHIILERALENLKKYLKIKI